MNEHLRQSGRTTRLAGSAVQLAASSHAVYVFMNTKVEAKELADKIDLIWGQRYGTFVHGIKVEMYTEALDEQFDWEAFRLRGTHTNVVVLMDHFVIEKRIERLQERMARIANQITSLYPKTI